MESKNIILEIAKRTFSQEAEAINGLISLLDTQFEACVQLILNSKGRVIITGIGKSANIAGKIVATLNSTGTPAIFMHAADAIHGDLGNVQPDDVVICISKSGNTPEIKVLAPLIKMMKNPLIAIVGNIDSFLALQANYVLNTTVAGEACPNNLAPTSSTTAQLVMGDALAVALLEMRGFTASDFAKYHPGGALGKMLYLTVGDLCKNNEVPKVLPNDSIKTLIIEISSKRLGVTAVLDENKKILGIVTDGDLRRMLQNEQSANNLKAKDIMNATPKLIEESEKAVIALEIMRTHNITSLLVTKEGQYFGVVHLHDILKEGII
ncbi:MAG: KpsF/GutQ family sugar-phosphate isomerase [Bacteroidota bacterium]